MALNMYLSMAVGVLALLLGLYLNKKIPFLARICIPAPVTGGLIVSLITLALHSLGKDIEFDGTLKEVCMMMFFTSVGFQSDLTSLKKGGKPLVFMIILLFFLIILQNFTSVGIAVALGLSPETGMAAGSIPMSGGHGTAMGFSSLLEDSGVKAAAAISTAAATFGLLSGSLLGGPLAGSLIARNKLTPPKEKAMEKPQEAFGEFSVVLEKDHNNKVLKSYTKATYSILLAMGLGVLFNKGLALLGLTVPSYFGALICAAILRNFSEFKKGCPKFEMNSIVSIGTICLSLFLGIALCSLKLWELSDLAVPLVLMLLAQVVLMFVFARYVAFPILGRDYNAAVMIGGICGFGLGATPNAMANMSAVCSKYGYSSLPFIVIPIIGVMFVDIMNIFVVTIFLNLM